MLTALNIVVRAEQRVILDRVSAEFAPGRVHLIIGPNGAGKSTFVKVLARLLPPHEGSVSYSEPNASLWTERELARHRAILSQAIEVAFPIPVHELIMMGRYPHFRGRPGKLDFQVCDDVMAYFSVSDLAERDYSTLSGGERQRVNFARVLAQIWRPLDGSNRYLFLDEPLTFLDIRHQIDFMKKVQEFARHPDVVVIGVVHDLNLAAKFGARLLLLHNARVVADGTAADVLSVENLQTAFDVTAIPVKDPVTGHTSLAFE